jgi:hypothetical protein
LPLAAIDSPGVVVGLYLAAAALAAAVACSELIGRFRDEPLKVLGGVPGLVYTLLNAGLSAAVLLGLRFASEPQTTTLALEQVFLAGFGARAIARTKVAGYQGQEIGPGAVFERLLAALSREADHGRAAERLQRVSTDLSGLEWDNARSFFVAEMVGAMQDLTDEEKGEITANVEFIDSNPEFDDATRLHLLGFLVLDYAGEAFLEQLVGLYRERFPSTSEVAGTSPQST